MNWKLELTYIDKTTETLYYRTKEEARRMSDFYSEQSRLPGVHIGKRVLVSKILVNR